MAIDWLTTGHVAGEWASITQAPVIWAASLAAVAILAYLAGDVRLSASQRRLEQQLRLARERVAAYERKLDVASPDEAEGRIRTLESRAQALSPRSLTERQRTQLTRLLTGQSGVASFTYDTAVSDARAFSSDFASCFQNAGWGVREAGVAGLDNPPAGGVGLRAREAGSLSTAETLVAEALRAIALPFDVQAGRPLRPHLPSLVDVEMIVGARLG